jgi:transcriptional regulator with XRE-family HTH domain
MLWDSDKNQKLLADSIGMTIQGLSKNIRSRTMKVDTLEKIALYFRKPIIYFFDENESINEANDPAQKYILTRCERCDKYLAQTELLKELLDKKDKQISELNREIGKKMSGKSNGKAS